MELVTIIGYSAGAVTALTFLTASHQDLERTICERRFHADVYHCCVNEVLWIAYGVLKDDWVIIVTNVIMLVMSRR